MTAVSMSPQRAWKEDISGAGFAVANSSPKSAFGDSMSTDFAASSSLNQRRVTPLVVVPLRKEPMSHIHYSRDGKATCIDSPLSNIIEVMNTDQPMFFISMVSTHREKVVSIGLTTCVDDVTLNWLITQMSSKLDREDILYVTLVYTHQVKETEMENKTKFIKTGFKDFSLNIERKLCCHHAFISVTKAGHLQIAPLVTNLSIMEGGLLGKKCHSDIAGGMIPSQAVAGSAL